MVGAPTEGLRERKKRAARETIAATARRLFAERVMVGASADIEVVGGYPDARDWDLMVDDRMTDLERNDAIKRIMMLPIPDRDPVTGAAMDPWRGAPSSVQAYGDWNIGDVDRCLIPTEREQQFGSHQALERKGFGIAPHEKVPAGNGRKPLESIERRGGIPTRQE